MKVVAPLPGWNVRGWSYAQRQEDGQLHPGADLNVGWGDSDLGLDVVCFADGVVVARRDWDGRTYGFGHRLLVAHRLGELALWTFYGHLDTFDDAAQEGQAVAAGQRLGACGKSGRQEWAHLHFECRYQGPPAMDCDFWGGRLAIEELSARYADPFTLLVVLAGLPEGLPEGASVDPAAVAALQADRDFNYRLKMAFEAHLRAMEGRRVRLKPGTVERLIAAARN